MFAFDQWAEWLAARADDFQREGLKTTYLDTRAVSECASNPAFGLTIETGRRVGSIRFWRVGLCDFEVLEKSTAEMLANETMLDANDETVSSLVARFTAFFGQTR